MSGGFARRSGPEDLPGRFARKIGPKDWPGRLARKIDWLGEKRRSATAVCVRGKGVDGLLRSVCVAKGAMRILVQACTWQRLPLARRRKIDESTTAKSYDFIRFVFCCGLPSPRDSRLLSCSERPSATAMQLMRGCKTCARIADLESPDVRHSSLISVTFAFSLPSASSKRLAFFLGSSPGIRSCT
eukprot:scaffold556_cov221-Pinguiococcus_pyrenoidosus.AAC.2